ncbi:MAG: hypothetical protein M1826_004164 [Phylliscum demangeonii]|nr:MAG: hypothetical protein M1826_004164 [Phylliscum demangeonii]
MPGLPPSPSQIVRSYRDLYRQSLQAVQYACPARYVIRDRLRRAFRKGSPEDYQHDSIQRTLEFLRGATRTTGMEHRILKHLLHVRYWQARNLSVNRYSRLGDAEVDPYAHFDKTLEMLNASFGLCLR